MNILTPKAGTLRHAKAVLFVNNHKTERRKINGILNNRMGPDQYFHISCQQTGENGFPPFSFDRARQQFHADIHTEQ